MIFDEPIIFLPAALVECCLNRDDFLVIGHSNLSVFQHPEGLSKKAFDSFATAPQDPNRGQGTSFVAGCWLLLLDLAKP